MKLQMNRNKFRKIAFLISSILLVCIAVFLGLQHDRMFMHSDQEHIENYLSRVNKNSKIKIQFLYSDEHSIPENMENVKQTIRLIIAKDDEGYFYCQIVLSSDIDYSLVENSLQNINKNIFLAFFFKHKLYRGSVKFTVDALNSFLKFSRQDPGKMEMTMLKLLLNNNLGVALFVLMSVVFLSTMVFLYLDLAGLLLLVLSSFVLNFLTLQLLKCGTSFFTDLIFSLAVSLLLSSFSYAVINSLKYLLVGGYYEFIAVGWTRFFRKVNNINPTD